MFWPINNRVKIKIHSFKLSGAAGFVDEPEFLMYSGAHDYASVAEGYNGYSF